VTKAFLPETEASWRSVYRAVLIVTSNLSLNPLKQELVFIIFKNSVRTAKKTPHVTITKISGLALFKEIIAVNSENHIKPINTFYE
jgi:hypothetical protein